MSLHDRLAERIRAHGPIGIDVYMHACLHDPEDGYYAAHPALGADGDFITAPHVSQMFGELIGLWAADIWDQLGRPGRLRLVELGPGDGTLMADMLRAGGAASGFVESIELWLVETSPVLRPRQAAALAVHAPRWASSIVDVPDDRPVILIANEFLDCLPIRQAVRVAGAWRERRIGLGAAGALAFEADGPVRETSPAVAAIGEAAGALVARAGGAGLFIDYSRGDAGTGDTLQAVRGHRREGPLDNPGLADLTAQVDLGSFLGAARAAGALTAPVIGQSAFLRSLGVEARAEALRRARPDNAERTSRQLDRLIGAAGMGELFKVACLHAPGLAPAGFEAA